MLSKGITFFFRGEKRNPVSIFPEDRECITLTSIEGDRMISHNVCNLVLDRLEEECDSTVALLKI